MVDLFRRLLALFLYLLYIGYFQRLGDTCAMLENIA
jgi:hypothetical protein